MAHVKRDKVTAKDIMSRPVIAATPSASLRDLAGQLVANEFACMPVVAEDGTVVGIVTESDIVRVLMAGSHLELFSAGQVMTTPAITVNLDTPVEEVMRLLVQNRIVQVPVTTNEKLVGIISRKDVVRTFLEPEFIALKPMGVICG